MKSVRPSAVAGLFYPAEADRLQAWLGRALAPSAVKRADIPRALIAPHAGYVYSGQTAAKAFKLWQGAQEAIQTVVLLGPAHRVGFNGVATLGHAAMATPLGRVAVDETLRTALLQRFGWLHIHNAAHAPEHSLEVMLPFIQTLLPKAQVLPLLTGSVAVDKISELLAFLWMQPGVYVVISSDLSHFHPYAEAQALDAQTAAWIETKQWRFLDGEHACGYRGLQGLLALEAAEAWQIERLECLNSGDTAGTQDSVVGYGSWAIYENSALAGNAVTTSPFNAQPN